MSARILIAGVGNIFFGDDGFGMEVVRRLSLQPPEGAQVIDFGIRGLHLAYALLEPLDLLLVVDALSRGGAPGTVYALEPDLDSGVHDNPEPNVVSPAIAVRVRHRNRNRDGHGNTHGARQRLHGRLQPERRSRNR